MTSMTRDDFGTLMRIWRRKRGLSQLDLAMAGNVSQRHVSFLESGRARPSRPMVLNLAGRLDMPLRETNRLLLAAGFAPAYREGRLDEPSLAEARRALELILRQHEPFPCLAVDAAWNVLLANGAAQRLLGRLGVPLDPPLNLARLTLGAGGLRPYITNWAESAPAFLHRLQREAMESPACAAILAELRRDPLVAELSRRVEADIEPRPILPVSLSKEGVTLNLISMIASFGTPQDVLLQELRIESFFPADEASEQVLRALAAG
jgi:transcriptional regulator with XRE-family HTH domain